jgi:hypothetical protein
MQYSKNIQLELTNTPLGSEQLYVKGNECKKIIFFVGRQGGGKVFRGVRECEKVNIPTCAFYSKENETDILPTLCNKLKRPGMPGSGKSHNYIRV